MIVLIALGLVNWLATLLVTESEFFRPLRDWIRQRALHAERRFPVWLWDKADYFITCPLCTGVWIGLALVPWAPALFGAGVIPFLLTALLIKAIGHAVYVTHKLVEATCDQRKAEIRRMEIANAASDAQARQLRKERRAHSAEDTNQGDWPTAGRRGDSRIRS